MINSINNMNEENNNIAPQNKLVVFQGKEVPIVWYYNKLSNLN